MPRGESEYRVECTDGSSWYRVIRAGDVEEAAILAAECAHSDWAWECEWPITFRVIKDGKAMLVSVELEAVPEFYAADSVEDTSYAPETVSEGN